ncbi:SDR family NAD(P)-dependent oxidoreductase [Aestuariivirga sp.]|uniref:SDR family NAD(P)-dependent oxidoreductase n=1 Tax=Aestuariivirga sp. TaxID=2650926 RepID=UPI00391A30FD
MAHFNGKRILVTGSTRGIGNAVATRLLDEGATVILHGRSLGAVRSAAGPLRQAYGSRVEGHPADLADREQCRSLCRAAGDVDVLINCAGVLESRPLADTDAGHWQRVIDVNTTAPWILARGLLSTLRSRRGLIVNVSSDAGLLGYAGHSAYCASKGALIGLTRALAVELAPDVRALCVCPGPVDTDMMRKAVAAEPEPETARASWAKLTLLGRVAKPEEIAAAIVFAASPDCSFATGNLISVDGGATAGRRV